MASTGEEERDLFDEEEEEEDDDSVFDSEDEYVRDEAAPPPLERPPAASGQDPNPISSFPSDAAPSSDGFPIPIPNPNPNPNPNLPHNGVDQTLLLSYPAPASTDLMFATPSPDRKRQRSAAASEESRRMFQKLWTDEDEIAILQGFLEFTSQRGTTHADYQYDTGPFFDQIRTRLQLEFNKNQIVEKLRRLKRKYRNAVARIAAGKESVFKSSHDRATFEISRKIWSSSFKRARKRRASRPPAAQGADLCTNGAALGAIPQLTNEAVAVPVEVTVKESDALPAAVAHVPPSLAPPLTSAVEETVRCCLSPLFKELLQCVVGGAGGFTNGGLVLDPLQLNLLNPGATTDERWKQQKILELEVSLKRTELVKEHIKAALEELRSADS